jgi:hypothetical protein
MIKQTTYLRQKIRRLAMVGLLVVGLSNFLPATPASAIDVFEGCTGNSDAKVCNDQGSENASNLMRNIINTMIFLIGAIAVIMIIIGGFRYVVSNGEAGALTSAKNTILYSVIGLIVAILSYGVVEFVLDNTPT